MTVSLIEAISPLYDQESRHTGTGFYVSPSGLLVTCAHVVEACGGVLKTRCPTKKVLVDAYVLSFDAEHDVAIVQTDSKPTSVATLAGSISRGAGITSYTYMVDVDGKLFPAGYPLRADVIDQVDLRDERGARRLYVIGRLTRPIQRGMSGAPAVDLGNGKVVGLISHDVQAGFEGLVIPISYVANIGHSIAGFPTLSAVSSAPRHVGGVVIPPNVVQRDSLAGAINSALALFGIAVLLGPSGSGKTFAAAAAVEAFNDSSVWLNSKELTSASQIPGSELIVIDDVEAGSSVIIDHLARTTARKLLITTRDNAAVEAILQDRLMASNRAAVIEVAGFSSEEGLQFLHRAIGSKLSDTEKRLLVDGFKGLPLALRAVADLLNQDAVSLSQEKRKRWWPWWGSPRQEPANLVLFDSRGALNSAATIEGIMGTWVYRVNTPSGQQLLRLLSRTSLLGMSLDVLTRCSGLSQKQVEGAIAPAIDGGFVKKLFSQRLGTLTLVPHDILRGHFVALDESEEDLRADKCYLQNTQNINGTSSSGDIITRIDRLFAQIRIAFTEYWREHKDSERLSNKLELALADLSDLSCEERLSSAQAMDITRLFEQALVLPVAHACPAVIAVAHSVRSMARSPRFGDMIWSGASCYDGWARAASIVAAVGHWKGDSSGRQENIERCQLWYRSFGIQNRDYFKGEWDKLHPTGFDWDLAALAVAFFVLGAPDEGMEIFHDASTRWIEPGAEAQMLHASAIVALTDAGDQERLAELFRLALKRPTTAHLDTALAYAAKHHNRLAILSKTSPRYGKFNLSVGFAAQSDRFKKYAKELAPKQFTYL